MFRRTFFGVLAGGIAGLFGFKAKADGITPGALVDLSGADRQLAHVSPGDPILAAQWNRMVDSINVLMTEREAANNLIDGSGVLNSKICEMCGAPAHYLGSVCDIIEIEPEFAIDGSGPYRRMRAGNIRHYCLEHKRSSQRHYLPADHWSNDPEEIQRRAARRFLRRRDLTPKYARSSCALPTE